MGKDRVAAFSDGVIAILITIMVLELRVPHGADFAALESVWPSLLTYALSFVYLGIYWSNHHHLLYTVTRVDGLILWANLDILFWLSLIPVATAWMGQNLRNPADRALWRELVAASHRLLPIGARDHSPARRQSMLAKAIGSDIKGKISPVHMSPGSRSRSWRRGFRLRSTYLLPCSGSSRTGASRID